MGEREVPGCPHKPRAHICYKCYMGIIRRADKEIDDLKATVERLEKESQLWQEMCEKHVGVSPLADTFANELHDPECFGDYVENLQEQINSLEARNKELEEGYNKKASVIQDLHEKGLRLESKLNKAVEALKKAVPLLNGLAEEYFAHKDDASNIEQVLKELEG